MKNYLFNRIFFLSFIVGLTNLYAQSDTASNKAKYKFNMELSAEYFRPVDEERKIQTICINVFFWKQYFKNILLLNNIGIITIYADGSIIKYEVDTIIQNQFLLLKPVEYKTSAFGIGPALQSQFEAMRIHCFSIEVEVTIGCIFYNKNFPPGGDFYNFLFREGASLGYKFNKKCIVKLGYRWMHISNGQGRGDHNPGYNSQGINLGFTKYF